jgi:hypothetical protein
MATTARISGLDLVVCACGGREYTVGDAIDAALFRGELEDKWKKFLRDVAAEIRADELDLDVDEASVSAAAEVFRYEHELITTEETQAWLTSRGLTIDDFSDYFTRRYYAGAIRENVVSDEIEYHSAPAELRQLFIADLILSGELERITIDLMWRLAARCAQPDPAPELVSSEARRFVERSGVKQARLEHWLEKLGRDSKWFDEMTAIEAVYRNCRSTFVDRQLREHELTASRLELTQFEVEVIELESRDAAQEALLCLREDGMSMEEVAAEGRYPYRRANLDFARIPTDLRHRFLGASAGTILEPLARGDGFELYRVLNKIEPQADDPSVQSQIDRRLLDRHFSELMSKHVQPRFATVTAAR